MPDYAATLDLAVRAAAARELLVKECRRPGGPRGSGGPGPDDMVLVSQGADEHPAGNLPCVAPGRFRPLASIAYRLAKARALRVGAAFEETAAIHVRRNQHIAFVEQLQRPLHDGLRTWRPTKVILGPPTIGLGRQSQQRPRAGISGYGFLLTVGRASVLQQGRLLRLGLRTRPHFRAFVIGIVDQR